MSRGSGRCPSTLIACYISVFNVFLYDGLNRACSSCQRCIPPPQLVWWQQVKIAPLANCIAYAPP
ncbi:MAG: hypothetical protein NTY71_04755 [Methanoregula sp.]|nr:hypothetical protein [Methanoregula sp.]